ncbi:sulfite exporter TauE/SafE family protein [Mycolicibacterium sphagni]|uniref:sulfite exporter TauE/SafE family protein n=1 Tax=Mycolicibacterium sphagni TaxID=1786 RepID=UPI001F045E36|nr:sulfite exporter TauE/SafE family protein [Mycolicibacterium sphagni]
MLIAGVLGGLTGSIAGLASVATYPALLAVGLPPVTANVTNTVALVFNGIGSAWGSRPELAGQGRFLVRSAPVTVAGGALGAVLLLTTPADSFEKVVPVLLAVASAAIVVPRGAPHPGRRRRAVLVAETAAMFGIALYGGYFGAAAGVLFLALLLNAGADSLAHANAAKNILLGLANVVAAVVFAVLAPVHWLAVIPLGAGCLIGSRLGPIVVRHAPSTPLRILIGIAGLALAVKLGFDAYR